MTTLPTLFVSHGAPTFAIEPGRAGGQLRAVGRALRQFRAIVIVSPHWMTPGVEITAAARPETVHDFGGFPRALYALRYPAPGSPEVAARVQQLLLSQGIAAALDHRRGLDHGAWVPLLHMYPEADVPVVQVSLPRDADEARALALGRALAPLAAEGVLVIGSGSLTHNPGDQVSRRAPALSGAGRERMQAAWYEARGIPGNVRVVGSMPHAQPGPGEVRIRMGHRTARCRPWA